MDFIRDHPCDVSGCATDDLAYSLYDRLRSAFEAKFPGELQVIEEEHRKRSGVKQPKATMWEKLKENETGEDNTGSFSFGF